MKLSITLLLTVFGGSAFGQNITGLWQAETTVVASDYLQNYVFGPGKKFTYNTTGYDGLQRVSAIGGHYNLVGDTLYLTSEYTIELRGGIFLRSHTTTLNDSWEISGGQQKKYLIAKPITEPVYFKLVKRKMGLCMLLDSSPYYKIKTTGN